MILFWLFPIALELNKNIAFHTVRACNFAFVLFIVIYCKTQIHFVCIIILEYLFVS